MSIILSLAAKTRRRKKRWSETVRWSDSQQLSSGKLKSESWATDSICRNKDGDGGMERQKSRGQREEETTLGIVGLECRSNTQQHIIEFKLERLQTKTASCFPDSVSSIMSRPERRRSSRIFVTYKIESKKQKKKRLYLAAHDLSRAHTGICLCE